MPGCAFYRCTNSSKTKSKAQDITYHSFPEDELVKHKWLVVLRDQRRDPEWVSTKNSRVCSMHFRPEDMYTTDKGYRKVHKSAVPFFKTGVEATNSGGKSLSKTALELISETPRIKYLKEKLRKSTITNRKLLNDNRNLKKQNARLKKKYLSLKEAITQSGKKLKIKEELYRELVKQEQEEK